MVAYQVIGYDTAVTISATSGQLETNVMTPLIIHNILQSMDLLVRALTSFNQHCAAGIQARAAHCADTLAATGAPILALASLLGPDEAKSLADEQQSSGQSLKEVVLAREALPKEDVDKLLSCRSLTQPGARIDTTGSGG